MTDTIEAKNLDIKTSNMETNSALPPEETDGSVARSSPR